MKKSFNLKILENGEIIKANTTKKETIVYIQDKTVYSILLENNSNITTDVFLKIDGKKMGTYRLIPNEKYELNRPIRRKKELIFLKKTEEYKKNGLFSESNKELGVIEAEFKTGVINIKNKEVSNKKVFRPENKGYIPEYMNIYKNRPRKKFIKKSNIVDKPIEIIKDIPKKEMLISQELEPEPECCDPCPESEPECCDSCPSICEDVMENNNYTKDSGNGFTVYGDKIDNKFKTYHQLLYDGNSTNIKLILQCEKSYQKL